MKGEWGMVNGESWMVEHGATGKTNPKTC